MSFNRDQYLRTDAVLEGDDAQIVEFESSSGVEKLCFHRSSSGMPYADWKELSVCVGNMEQINQLETWNRSISSKDLHRVRLT